MPFPNYKVQFSIAFGERICFAVFPYVLVFTRYGVSVRSAWPFGRVVECPLALHQRAMPTEQRFRFENQDQLSQMDFLEIGELTELRNQGQQDELFTVCHGRTAFLMAPQDKDLLT